MDQGEFSEANAHVEKAKSHTVNGAYILGRVKERQARVWDEQGRLRDPKLEAERALEIHKELGAGADAQRCRSNEGPLPDSRGELPETIVFNIC